MNFCSITVWFLGIDRTITDTFFHKGFENFFKFMLKENKFLNVSEKEMDSQIKEGGMVLVNRKVATW